MGGFGSRGIRRGAGFALLIAALAAVVFVAPAQANVDYFGVNNGQAIRSGTVTPSLFYNRLTRMGGNVLREDVLWNAVEPKDNQWQFNYLDNEINPLNVPAAAQVGVILDFLNSPGWARDPVENLSACAGKDNNVCMMPPATTKLNEWKDFVRTTVNRYRSKVVAVEVWNEPNYKNFWRPNADQPERWAQLVQAAAQATADVDPNIPIITGGLGSALKSNPDAAPNIGMEERPYLEAAYASLPALPQYVDGIGVHAYAGNLAPSDPSVWNRYRGSLTDIRAARDARDPGKPLWVTETGYHTQGSVAVTEAQQRDWLMAEYDDLSAAPDVKAMIIHNLFDSTWLCKPLSLNCNQVESSYGLVKPVGPVDKPAWTAFHNRLAPGS